MRLLASWHSRVVGDSIFPGNSFNLDFHSVSYYGEHPSVQKHYVSMRSRRQPSLLVFLAQDAETHAFCYANADLRKGDEPEAVFHFIHFWKQTQLKEIVLLPRSAWRTVNLDMPTRRYQTPRYYEQNTLRPTHAHRECPLLAERIRGYRDAQARQIFRDLVAMPATITITEKEVEVSFHRRSHLPIILASGMMEQPVAVPWWNSHKLRLTTYNGPTKPPTS